MNINMPSKTLCRIYMILGCFLVWIVYTYTIVQLLKSNSMTPNAKKLDFAQGTDDEIDQKASVCFKDVIPFSIPLIQGSKICQNKPDLLIVIHTEAEDFKIRNAYRNEFVDRIRNISVKYDFRVDIVYLLGLNKHYCILAKTVEEIVIHEDMLVGSFIDHYYNQTLKSITMLEWFVKYCKSASVLLKIDDRMDPAMSMETDDFYSLIRNVKDKDKVLMGSVHDIEITTNQQIPWISLPYLYPGLPKNLHLNYLVSREAAENLLKAYADTVYISVWKEDLYITGILANIAKVKIRHDKNFLIKCDTKACLFCSCGKFINDNLVVQGSLTATATENNTQFTSDKLIHSMPKRDTQASFQMYSSQPITTGTYPTTHQQNDEQSTYFTSTTEYTTAPNSDSTTHFTTITTKFDEKYGTDSTSSYTITTQPAGREDTVTTKTSSYTTTTQTIGRDDTITTTLSDTTTISLEKSDPVTTTETSTTNTLSTTTSLYTERTEQSTLATLNDDFDASFTKSSPDTTESAIEHTTNGVSHLTTTVGSDLSTTTVGEVIPEIISLTDIAILQIDEFELGFAEIPLQDFGEDQEATGTISTNNINTLPRLWLSRNVSEETSNDTIFHNDASGIQISELPETTMSATVYESEGINDAVDLNDPSTWKIEIVEQENLNDWQAPTSNNDFGYGSEAGTITTENITRRL